MPPRPRSNPDETRARIVDVAEDLFRRIGFEKTTVADIADALGMSSANVYRFFATKSLINNAICERMLGEMKAMLDGIVAAPGPASERIERAILDLHRYSKARFTDQRQVHDIVRTAMEENWAAIEVHKQDCARAMGGLVSYGIESGEFPPCDAEEAGATLMDMCVAVIHPDLIAKPCGNEDLEAVARRLIAFGLRALRAPLPDPIPIETKPN
jgi:AcrR family transcriptional regulator